MSLANSTSLKKTSSSSGTTDSPYLGSKISLVSKAKIRYEGILYTIDANESTVALSKVRSFGTEDRPTDRPVPARDEIFEYIIFRGADIEDLQVREPPQSSLSQDPAIVESSVYPDNARSNTTGTNTNLAGLSQNGQARSSSNRGTMPSPPHRQNNNKGFKSWEPSRYNQQRSSRRFDQQSPLGQYDDYSYGNSRRPTRQQDYYNDYLPSRRNNGYASDWSRQSQRFPRQQQQQQQQNYNDNRYYSSRRQQPTGRFAYRERRNSTGGIPNSNQQQTRNSRQQRDRSNNGTANRSTLKFVGDFDFEKSNAEFDKNAIEDEIKKSLSIKTDGNTDSPKTEQEKDKENHQTTSTQSEQQNHQEEINLDGYYDKQKSFFDRISCESTAKENTNTRRNWNEERRVNAETFGLKYRPFQQGTNQRTNYRRNNYNNDRYQRQGNRQNAFYYGNFNSRVRAY